MKRENLSECKEQEFVRGQTSKTEPQKFLMHSFVFMWVKIPVLRLSCRVSGKLAQIYCHRKHVITSGSTSGTYT